LVPTSLYVEGGGGNQVLKSRGITRKCSYRLRFKMLKDDFTDCPIIYRTEELTF
jgi:hypothetical protein